MDAETGRGGKDGDGLGRGDEVTWKSHGRRVTGKVKKKITERTRAAGRTVDASDEQPQYEVESEASGRSAVHKPDALRKKGRSG
ncbi:MULTISPECIES: hypervirulence associated TUDOR domain-containing protein [Streptomyces]|uniref:DUF2945 domain-containing protein n=1 Tax=Streptomyces TaxID=1883 RepID=UPI0004C9C3E5|nr:MULTISPECIES: DUF2945 domain-containing protein [unclassified Streptomyces]AQT75757.1 hypothetical protein B1K54_32835 [Streptomyces sp. fd1-xmd]MDX6763125.1 DUF2945 domain-containing protein [Streptomyces sp. F8]